MLLLLHMDSSYPFSACTHPAPTKGMHTSIVFCWPQPMASHNFLQGKSIWDSLPYSTGKNSPISPHQQAPNTNYVCYLSVCSGSRPWAALLLLEQSSCQAVRAPAMQAGDAPQKPADDRIALWVI